MRFLAVLVLALAVVACSDSTDGPPPPDPVAEGPVVAQLVVESTTFVLHDEGEGCFAVEVQHEGLQQTVERTCAGANNPGVKVTDSCGFLAAGAGRVTGTHADTPCRVVLPTVFFGQIVAPVAYVCVAAIHFDSNDAPVVDTARFLSAAGDGLVLEVAMAGERTPFLFRESGSRLGSPPLDRPSEPIYEACEAIAPWK